MELFQGCRDAIQLRYGCFQLLGVDILLTEDLTPILMEVCRQARRCHCYLSAGWGG